jgi:hypothetical protein
MESRDGPSAFGTDPPGCEDVNRELSDAFRASTPMDSRLIFLLRRTRESPLSSHSSDAPDAPDVLRYLSNYSVRLSAPSARRLRALGRALQGGGGGFGGAGRGPRTVRALLLVLLITITHHQVAQRGRVSHSRAHSCGEGKTHRASCHLTLTEPDQRRRRDYRLGKRPPFIQATSTSHCS